MGIKAKFKLPSPTSKADWGKAFRDVERMVASKELKPDEGYMLYLTTGKPVRTTKQNSFYWAVVIKTFAEYIGYENDELHEIFKQMFAGYEMRPFPGFKRKKMPKSTSGMSKEEFSLYLEKCIKFCAEHGCNFPAPEAIPDDVNVELVSSGVLK
jgi:hypothetical protein